MFLNYKTEQKYESTKIIYEDLFYMKNTIWTARESKIIMSFKLWGD